MAKRKTSGTPIQYAPVQAAPVSTTREEQDTHLRAFIRRFIVPAAQSRWAHCLLASPEKAMGHLHRFDRDQNPCCCCEMKGPDSFPLSLGAVCGSERGGYFAGKRAPCQM